MGRIVGQPATCTKKGWGGVGDPTRVCRPPLRWLSQFLSYEKERIQLLMTFLLRTFFMVEWVDIYKGEIMVTFLVGW